ncbi:hypothetical protein Kisp01_51440 [Kineosporia sp. NBRC 101677]|nr:hypothetical protein Kisp01_51440 [Kineosporia sp. NBRC 101677]
MFAAALSKAWNTDLSTVIRLTPSRPPHPHVRRSLAVAQYRRVRRTGSIPGDGGEAAAPHRHRQVAGPTTVHRTRWADGHGQAPDDRLRPNADRFARMSGAGRAEVLS